MGESAKYQIVKRYYDSAVWGEPRVRDAVEKGWISAEEYERITCRKYE